MHNQTTSFNTSHFQTTSSLSNFYNNCSSRASTHQSPDSATKNRSGAQYTPIHQPHISQGNLYRLLILTFLGAELIPAPRYPAYDELAASPYHYVKMDNLNTTLNPLNESFCEGFPNQNEINKIEEQTGLHNLGMQGLKVLEPGMSDDNESTADLLRRTNGKSSSQQSPPSPTNLAPQAVSHGLPNLGNTCYM